MLCECCQGGVHKFTHEYANPANWTNGPAVAQDVTTGQQLNWQGQPTIMKGDPMGAIEGILWLRDRLGSVSWGKNDCQVSCEANGTRHYATGKTFVDAVYKLREAVS